MKRLVTLLGAVMVLAGVFGFSYTWHVDHRSASSLGEYCRVDFLSSRTETGKLEGAVLTLWDYRYGGERLLPKAVLYTDGSPWEMVAKVKQTVAVDEEHSYQHENKLFVELPTGSLSSIRKAESIRLRFYYENGYTVDLPLDERELEYWRRQVEP